MRAVRLGFLSLLATVLGAHLLAYCVIQVLPDPVTSILGFQSAHVEAREALNRSNPPRSYGRILADMAHGDLGLTLDGVDVSASLADGAKASLPRLAAGSFAVILVVILVSLLPYRLLPAAEALGSFLAFFPPFMAPFLMIAVLLAVQDGMPGAPAVLEASLCAAAVAVPACAFAAAQAAAITRRNLAMPFAVMIRAVGATPGRLRIRLLHHLAVELAPTLEKLAIGLFTALLFAESAFGQSGLGSLAIRAIRRGDTDLILALVLASALLVGLLRVATEALRRHYGVATG